MTEEKRNRLIAAVTVNVIILIAVLMAVVIYQLCVMVYLNNLENDLNERIDYVEHQTNINEETLNYYKSEEGLLDKAYEYGFISGK